MTELEQKAEKYFMDFQFQKDFEGFPKAELTDVKKAYKDGYEQGQKDYTQFVDDFNSLYGKGENECLYNEFAKLKKENAELKEEITRCNEWLSVLKNENPTNFAWKKDCLALIRRDYIEENEKLRKENTELKTKLEYVLNCNEELTCKLETIQNYILNFNFERDVQILDGIKKVIEK